MLLHQPYDSEASKDPQDVRQQAWPAGDRIAVIAGATARAELEAAKATAAVTELRRDLAEALAREATLRAAHAGAS